jgi:hypothetical protein
MVARLQRFVEPFSSGTGFSCLDALFAFVISGAVTGVREEVNFIRRYPRTERVCKETSDFTRISRKKLTNSKS